MAYNTGTLIRVMNGPVTLTTVNGCTVNDLDYTDTLMGL